jgi:hypothetical protein
MTSEFGLIKEKMNHGLFGCTMTWILEILPYLKKNNIYPKWDIDTNCYGKIIPALIIPNNITVSSNKEISLTELKTKYMHTFDINTCNMANSIFFEYFRIAPDILEKVEIYKKKFVGKTLGIHYRGTDKIESTYISIELFIRNIIAFLDTNMYDSLLILSDEQDFINKITQTITLTKYNIIITDSRKSVNGKPLHLEKTSNINDAKDAMIDSLLLSKCDYVIKTSSALSDWVIIWNPSIRVYNLNKFLFTWFPHATIPTISYL